MSSTRNFLSSLSSNGDPNPPTQSDPQSDTQPEIVDNSNKGTDSPSGLDPELYGDPLDLLPGQFIDDKELPSESRWALHPMTKTGANGTIYFWQVGYDPETERIVTLHGTQSGKKIVSSRRVLINNSGRSVEEQAIQMARSVYNDNYHLGYRPIVESNDHNDLPSILIDSNPMLANDYWPGGYDPKKGRDRKSNVTKFPVAVQAKLDGVRSQIRRAPCVDPNNVDDPHRIQARSRENRNQVHSPNHLLHIREELIIFFKYLPSSSELDGELYSHDMTLDILKGVISTFKKGVHARHSEVKYYIFDIKESQMLSYGERYLLLVDAFKRYLEDGHQNNHFYLLQCEFANSHEEIRELHNEYVSLGYEGAIVRKIKLDNFTLKEIQETLYRPCRCNNLLKVKDFITDEAVIIEVQDGEGTDEGLAIFYVEDKHGNRFRVRPRGSFERRRKWFADANKIIGKRYTYRYFETTDGTETGLPRFPTGITIRNYE